MIKAVGQTPAGQVMVVLGLEPENLRRLANDEPIVVDLRDLGVDANVTVAIVGGEDVARLVAHARQMGARERTDPGDSAGGL